jgi:hypothetical protein
MDLCLQQMKVVYTKEWILRTFGNAYTPFEYIFLLLFEVVLHGVVALNFS